MLTSGVNVKFIQACCVPAARPWKQSLTLEVILFMYFYFALFQGHMEADGQAEPPTEILVPVCLKPEEGLEVWCLWAQRKNSEMDKQEKIKLAPIGRRSPRHTLNRCFSGMGDMD